MKTLQNAVTAMIAAAVIMAAEARANSITYDIGFTGGGSAANGQIVVNGGVATSGFLDVTAGPAQGDYSLYTWSGGGVSSVRVDGGTDLIVDNLVNFGSDPFLDVDGLAFVSSDPALGQPHEGIDFSLLGGTTYNLGGFGDDGYYVPNANGVATLSAAVTAQVSVPDKGCTAGLLGAASLGLIAFAGSKRQKA